ncbi:putative beta-glucosidase D [Phyllosticta citrichinensis]
MSSSFARLSGLSLLLSGASAYSANSTAQSQLLSSGSIKLGDWESAYARAKTFVDGLTVNQKIAVINGEDITNFTALYQRDSGDGILDFFYATAWPLSSALAMAWDRDLFYQQNKALADEFYAKGIQMAKGPVSEPLGRSPWGGRNSESFGPDPYLNGIAFADNVKAFNDAGVISCSKHFLLSEQENYRTSESSGDSGGGGAGGPPRSSNSSTSSSGPSSSTTESMAYNAIVDDKTLHETYMFPFYDGIHAGAGAVMCALNRVNETYACESQDLLGGLLKEELGFPGLVLGDVGGQKTVINSANAGLDFGFFTNDSMVAGLNNGSISEARLNDMAIRNILPSFKLNQDNGKYPETADLEDYVDPRKLHRNIARKVGAAFLVLLKNENNALPLKSPKTMAVFGAHATPKIDGPNDELSVTGSDDVLQGHAASIGGSGYASFAYLVTPHHALLNRVIEDGTQLRYLFNDTGYSQSSSGGMGGVSGYSSGTAVSHTYSDFAGSTEVCLVFLNAYSGEGADRGELYNADQDAMVAGVASACNNTIVVINAVAARLVDAWIENENITAVVYGSMLGEQSGNSIVDVLYGDYFDKANVTPRYEFGYGLSYTTFNFSSELAVKNTAPEVLAQKYATGSRAIGGCEDLWTDVVTVSTQVSNTGSVAGAEVAQLYVSFPDAAEQPVKVLRGFEKVHLEPGKSAPVTFTLRRRDLSYWDIAAQNWAVAPGT